MHIQCVNRHLKFYHVVLFVQLEAPTIYPTQHPIRLLVLKIKISNGVVKIVLYYTMFHFLWWRRCAKGSTDVMLLTIKRSLKTNIWNSAWVDIVFNGKQWSNWGRTFENYTTNFLTFLKILWGVSLHLFWKTGRGDWFCQFEIYNYTYNIHTYNMRMDSSMNYYYYV